MMIINATLGPLIGVVVQPIVGALSDKLTVRMGRRRVFLLAGVIITVIGMALSIAFSIPCMLDTWKTSSLDSSNEFEWKYYHAVEIFAMAVTYTGLNILQVVSRTLVLDSIPINYQHPCALMFILQSSMARLLYHGVMSVLYLSTCSTTNSVENAMKCDNSTLLATFSMYCISILLLFVSAYVTFYTATESFVLSDPITCKTFIIDCIVSLKKRFTEAHHLFIKDAAIIFFGWLAFVSFDSNNSQFFRFFTEVYEHNDKDGLRPEIYQSFQCIMFVFVQLIYCFVMLGINKYPWWMMSISHFLSSLISLFGFGLITYFYIKYNSSSYTGFDGDDLVWYMIAFIFYIIPIACSSAQLLSVPYALLKNIVESDKFGFYVGVMNSAVITAQSVMYIVLYFLYEKSYDSVDTNDINAEVITSHTLSIVLYFIACVLCLFTKKIQEHHMEENQYNF